MTDIDNVDKYNLRTVVKANYWYLVGLSVILSAHFSIFHALSDKMFPLLSTEKYGKTKFLKKACFKVWQAVSLAPMYYTDKPNMTALLKLDFALWYKSMNQSKLKWWGSLLRWMS